MIPPELLFSLLAMQSAHRETNQLRSDVPAIRPVPDRARWEADHGYKPYRLTEGNKGNKADKPPSLTLLSSVKLIVFAHRARKCIERDLATIDREEAIRESVKLDAICERARQAFDVKHAEVFFDERDGQFWVYPHGWARHESVTR